MNQTLDIAITVSPEQSQAYRAMAARTRAARVVDDPSQADAVITDQAETAIQVAAEGRYTLLANPFGLQDGIAAQLESSTRAMPGLAARSNPSIEPVKKALQAGKLGVPGLLRVHRWQADPPPAVLAIELDLALWMFEAYPTEVYAVRRHGYLQVHLGFDRGGMALIDIDQSIPAKSNYYSLSLIGSTGAAYADDHRNTHLLLGAQGVTALPSTQTQLATAVMIGRFVEAVRSGRDVSDQWSDVRSAEKAARAVRSSADSERVLTGGGDE